ncbi:MAG: nuclear transport factor 2 family protein [Bacteroidota bacterium]
MIYQETNILRQLAKSWNNLDTSFIEPALARNLIYESQWVLIPIEGKRAFLSYLQSKFTAIKLAMQLEQMTVTAELALHPSMQNRPCIVLTQITKRSIIQVSVLVKVEERKIKRIEICFIPDPADAVLSGELPK